MMLTLKQKPSLPNPIGISITAEWSLMSEGKHYLLPGITKQNKELALLPPFKTGDKSPPKSLRENIAKVKLYIWYDLPLNAKKEALNLLLIQFNQESAEVARILGHSRKYVDELPRLVNDDQEYALACETKIEHRLTTSTGVAKDPMKFFDMPDEEGRNFLHSTLAAWQARVFDGTDPFVERAIQTTNKTALRFLLNLNKPKLFNKDQISLIITESEKRKEYDLLPDLCLSMDFNAQNVQSLLEFLFPNERSVKAMSPEQVSWRIQLLKQIEDPLKPVTWNSALKGLSVSNVAKIGTGLLTSYLIENLSTPNLINTYGNKDKTPLTILRANSENPAAKAHYLALVAWVQRFTNSYNPLLSATDIMVLLVQTALLSPLDVKYWPPFLEKQLEHESTQEALLQFFFKRIEEKQFNLADIAEDKKLLSVLGHVYDNLNPNQQAQITLYAQINALHVEYSRPGHLLNRTAVLKMHRFLIALSETCSMDEKMKLQSLPFYKVMSAIAATDPQTNAHLNPFEVNLLKGFIKKNEPMDPEPFAADTLVLKVLKNMRLSLEKQELLAQKDPIAEAKRPPPVNIPPKGTPEEKKWLTTTLEACEQAAHRDGRQDAVLTIRGLRHIHSKRDAIKQTFTQNLPQLRRGDDPLYVNEGVLIHFVNSNIIKNGQRVPDWDHMNDVLDNILYRMLTLFATATAWEQIDGNQEKLRSFFGSMDGYCMESRTRTLLDYPPAWATQIVLDDMDSLTQKIKVLVTQHQEYFLKNGQSFTASDAKKLLCLWFKGQFYQENGEHLLIESEHIEAVVDELGLPENAAASLLAAGAAAVQAVPQQPAQNVRFFQLAEPRRINEEAQRARHPFVWN